ncbi:MAG: hypothetical protein K9M75_08320 [Phycisphaerae bacterium]|nr:hypothetical protein [Phycisphaerae bacterium]
MKFENGTLAAKLCLAIILLAMVLFDVETFGAEANSLDGDNLFDMSLEELMNVEIISASQKKRLFLKLLLT